jgi:uncharacterized alkaline shock family protein YloU
VTAPAAAGTGLLGNQAAGAGRHSTRAEDRGRTSLSDKVVEKTVARAALEVDHVHGVSGGIATTVFNTDPAVEVRATIDGHLVQLRVKVEVDYPVSLRAVTRELRRHVSDRVQQLCELTVTDVDVQVTALRRDTEQIRRVR